MEERKRQVAMNDLQNIQGQVGKEFDKYSELLQKVANYRVVRKSLRQSGIGGIIFGAIAIVMGIKAYDVNPINAVLAAIGAFLAIEGLWAVFAPSLGGMIVDGIAFLILGIWNIYITIMNMANSPEGSPQFAVLGIIQIAWGIQRFVQYPRFSKMPQNKPSAEILRLIDGIMAEIKKTKLKDDPRIIEFQVVAFMGKQNWKGRLDGTSSVFMDIAGQDMVFARKTDVLFEKQGKVKIGKALNAAFKIGDRDLKGTIAPESFDRYEKWKSTVS